MRIYEMKTKTSLRGVVRGSRPLRLRANALCDWEPTLMEIQRSQLSVRSGEGSLEERCAAAWGNGGGIAPVWPGLPLFAFLFTLPTATISVRCAVARLLIACGWSQSSPLLVTLSPPIFLLQFHSKSFQTQTDKSTPVSWIFPLFSPTILINNKMFLYYNKHYKYII